MTGRRRITIRLITGLSLVFYMIVARGQCPGQKILWNRILYLRDSAKPPPAQQVKELSGYLDGMTACPYRNDSTHAFLLQRMGVLHLQLHDLNKGLYYTLRSIDLVSTNRSSPAINPRHVIRTYNNLRVIYDSLGNEKGRNEAIDSCISTSIRLNAGFEYSGLLLYAKTEALFEKGDYFRCISYASLAETIPVQDDNLVDPILACLIYKANSLIFMENYREAEKVIQSTIARCKGPVYDRYAGSLYGLLAVTYEKQGDQKRSLEYAQKAFSNYKKANDNNGCATVLNNLGFNLYFISLHRYNDALLNYKKALRYADSAESFNILDNIAQVYVKKGQFDSAFFFFRKAFDKIRPGIREEEIVHRSHLYLNSAVTAYFVNIMLNEADAWLGYFKKTKDVANLRKAIGLYKITDSLLEKIREEQSELQSQLFWRQDTRRLYEQALEATLLLGNNADAFYFFEKSKAVLLNDQLRDEHWLKNGDILKLAELKKKKNQLERESEINKDRPSSAAGKTIESDLFHLGLEMEKIRESIKKINPLYAQSYLDSNSITFRDVREKVLSDHAAFIEMFTGDSAVYLMVITPAGAKTTSIVRARFSQLVKKYTSYLADPVLLNKDYNGFVDASSSLFQLLFSNNPVPSGRIIISPDGEYFPFEALVENPGHPTPNTANSAASPTEALANHTPAWFLANHAVSYTYSAQNLRNDSGSPGSSGGSGSSDPSGGHFLGIAPLKYPYQPALSPLTGSDRSLEKISANYHHYENLVASAATKNKFLQQFPQYKIIQLYTHASENKGNGEPVIYFSDSALYLSDLVPANRPVTRLIVLSACETGTGKLYKGEGVFSFNRGFAALNIPSCVSNLWSVENEATYKLSELLYQGLAKGLPIDVALQNAKLEFLKTAQGERQLPYYWAAMVLVGKTTPLEKDNGLPWKYILGGLILAALLVVGWRRIRRRRGQQKSPRQSEGPIIR